LVAEVERGEHGGTASTFGLLLDECTAHGVREYSRDLALREPASRLSIIDRTAADSRRRSVPRRGQIEVGNPNPPSLEGAHLLTMHGLGRGATIDPRDQELPMADRNAAKIRSAFQSALEDGGGPPKSHFAQGRLPVIETAPALMGVYSRCLRIARLRLPKVFVKARPEVVSSTLMADLAMYYGIGLSELLSEFAMGQDSEHACDDGIQPYVDGMLDIPVLTEEGQAEFVRLGWSENLTTVQAFAMNHDPRRPLIRSLIALRPEGLAWVNLIRPIVLQQAPFAEVDFIWTPREGQWNLRMSDWRHRMLSDLENRPEGRDFIDHLRYYSGQAGLEWTDLQEGKRRTA
jgi:hypothetical protein